MTDTLKKICVTLTTLMSCIACHVQGFDGQSDLSDEISESCCSPAPLCAPQSDCCCGNFFLEGDFLYLRAFQGGLDICGPSEAIDVINPGSVTSFFNGKTHSPHFKWDPGFRLGLGYLFPNDWIMAVYWTDFHSKATLNHGDNHLFRWKLNFDVVDFIIGREFCIQSCLTITPFFGVRGARIDQTASSFELDTLLSTFDAEHNTSKFRGVGPLAGLQANWNLGCGWGVYADFALGGLWGKYKIHLNEASTFPFGGEFSHLHKNLDACQLVLDAGIGVSWRQCFWENNQFVVKIGLEQHRYFDQNRIGTYGDLCLSGGVISAAIEF